MAALHSSLDWSLLAIASATIPPAAVFSLGQYISWRAAELRTYEKIDLICTGDPVWSPVFPTMVRVFGRPRRAARTISFSQVLMPRALTGLSRIEIKNSRVNFLATLLFVLFFCPACTAAQQRPCSQAEATAAEESVTQIKNWTEIYSSFKHFGHCDDGAIAEGYSDTIVRMLALHWNHLNKLHRLVSSDSRFHVFVLQHIDATTDPDDLKKVLDNATIRCPSKARELCREIQKKTRGALAEF